MTTKFQISDKIGEAIFVISSEGADPGQAYGDFAVALSLVGNQQAEAVLGRLTDVLSRGAVVSTVADPLAAARATVQASFPGAVEAGGNQWGQPPVPAYQPPMPAAAAAPAPGDPRAMCQHGPKTLLNGKGKNPPHNPWQAWGCNAQKNDPSKCPLDFIR